MKTVEIEEWIKAREAELIEDISGLVEIPSVCETKKGKAIYGENCQRAAAYMSELAKKYGFDVEYCGGKEIRIGYGSQGKRVEIWNHLDVVPVEADWNFPPFQCTRQGDYLIGRGVSDNKGPAVAVLYALRYLKEQNISLHYELSQICGLSEEVGMEDAEWYVEQYGSPALALVSDCRFPMCYGEKGRCQVTVTSREKLPHVREMEAGIVSNSIAEKCRVIFQGQETGEIELLEKGVPGHAAAPENCVNPVGLLGDRVRKLAEEGRLVLTEAEEQFFEFLRLVCSDGYGEELGIAATDALFGKMTCAGTMLRLEDGKGSLKFDMRFPPELPMEEILKKLAEKVESLGCTISEKNLTGGYIRDLREPVLQGLLKAYREVYGESGQPYLMGGNTYARFFDCAVGYGPGIPHTPFFDNRQEQDLQNMGLPKGHGGAHSCDEVQPVSGLCDAVRVYVLALQELDKCMEEKDNAV